ncbi:MAG TPA: hypothetical protein PK636_01130 [bacterium]|nr:hypothetical protein [bacterium]HPJ71268.1 hypothetical protein [bacterium]HPQ67277.1 hypothetical protein [bacterium]
MKKLMGSIMVAAAVLFCAQGALADCHGWNHHGHSRHHHGGGCDGWETFGAVCAGLLGVGLIAAAVSDWEPPACRTYAVYPPPPPPPPPVYHGPVVYPAPRYCPPPPVVYYRPVYR